MRILFGYLKKYRFLVALILVLAAINQIFSLLDPVVFRHVIDDYSTRYSEYTTGQFFRGVSLLLAADVGVAFVSFMPIPILGALVSILSKNIKKIQKVIVAETTALAGATTESLRNIELVKSLGLAQQEIKRLNSTTGKILDLELNKVKYLRSLSFVQGTTVNAMRMSILGLMLYLIFAREITMGQFFSLWIYSFFIFGLLQEVGNVINVYRETEVSLKNFEDILNIPKEPRPAKPVMLSSVHQIEFDNVVFQHQSATTRALDGISFTGSLGETIAFVGPSGSGKTTLVKLLVGLYRPRAGDIRYDGF